jgi:multimeric flavodoxin WrbA
MLIVGVNGSPRVDGNTEFALGYALEQVKSKGIEIETINLRDHELRYCQGCFACRNGTCVHDDEMKDLLPLLEKCDGLILASPVYMGMVTSQMKTFMDRSVILRVNGFKLSGKIGGGIACGGFRNGGQELTLQNMQTFFLQQDMMAVSDGPRFSHSGAAIVATAAEDEVGLRTVKHLADRLCKGVSDLSN